MTDGGDMLIDSYQDIKYSTYLKILRRFRLCLFVLYWLLDKTGDNSFVLIYCAEG